MLDGEVREKWENLKKGLSGDETALLALFPDEVNPAPTVVEYTASAGALAPSVATLEASEVTYAVDTDAALAVTLPTPEPTAGTVVQIKDVTGTAPSYNITISATNNIDGDTVVINGARAAAAFKSRGSGNGYMLV